MYKQSPFHVVFLACDLANTVNITIDPCENFYEFACQGWLKKNIRPNYSSKWSVFSKMEKMTSDIVIGRNIIQFVHNLCRYSKNIQMHALVFSLFDMRWFFILDFLGLLSEPEKPDDMPVYKIAKDFFKKCSDVGKLKCAKLPRIYFILETIRQKTF